VSKKGWWTIPPESLQDNILLMITGRREYQSTLWSETYLTFYSRRLDFKSERDCVKSHIRDIEECWERDIRTLLLVNKII